LTGEPGATTGLGDDQKRASDGVCPELHQTQSTPGGPSPHLLQVKAVAIIAEAEPEGGSPGNEPHDQMLGGSVADRISNPLLGQMEQMPLARVGQL